MVGIDNSDDAAVYRLNESTAIINTVDFFTPIVDDAYIFGQIAAANALSDIYAMGGTPLLALNIVCFPTCITEEILPEVIRGGADKVKEAGAVIAGGHTVEDDEPKYGLAVTGTINPEQLCTNSMAREGDILFLTKPLGTGIINTAIKGELASEESAQQSIDTMIMLNHGAAQAMIAAGGKTCTDITGFGLLGHAAEMAKASGISIEIHSSSIPLINGTMDLAAMGMFPGGAYNNREYLKHDVIFSPEVNTALQLTLFDPQTSGGLLIAVPGEKAEILSQELNKKDVSQAQAIGKVTAKQDYTINVV